jgi:hypothetical protein
MADREHSSPKESWVEREILELARAIARGLARVHHDQRTTAKREAKEEYDAGKP